jgi:hypothetical protein
MVNRARISIPTSHSTYNSTNELDYYMRTLNFIVMITTLIVVFAIALLTLGLAIRSPYSNLQILGRYADKHMYLSAYSLAGFAIGPLSVAQRANSDPTISTSSALYFR